VVATDVGAVGESVTHGQTGFVVPPRDAGAIAAAALAYLTMPQEQVQNMVTAARKRVENTFSADIMALQQHQVYVRALNRVGGSRTR
jgi:glycosyltransferase involved in cell wall biosynthesis